MTPARFTPRELFALGRSYLFSLGGEGVQSVFHFALNLILIRAATVRDYGIFAIVFIVGGIAITYGNATVSVPVTVHIPKLRSSGSIAFLDVVFGSVAVATSGALAVLVGLGLWLTVCPAVEAMAAGAFVGLWTLRNHVRATLFARRAMPALTLSDLSYSAGGAAFVAVLLWGEAGEPQVTSVFWALAVANVIGIGVALKAVHARVRISFRRSVLARYRVIWADVAWSLFGVTMWNIQGQAQTFLVAAMAGPAAYAPIAAGIVLFNPLRLTLGAVFNVIRPEFAVGLADRHYARVRLAFHASFAVMVLACCAFGACVWLGWSFLDAHFYGGKFAHASMPVIVALGWIAATLAVCYHVPLTLVQAAHDFRAVAIATTIGGSVGLGAVLFLLLYTTVAWSLAGVVAGEAMCLIYLWIAAMRVLSKEHAGLPISAVHAPVPAARRLGSAGRGGLDRG